MNYDQFLFENILNFLHFSENRTQIYNLTLK